MLTLLAQNDKRMRFLRRLLRNLLRMTRYYVILRSERKRATWGSQPYTKNNYGKEKKQKPKYRVKSQLVKLPEEVKIPKTSADLIVITKAKNLFSYVFQITKNSPKKFRQTFVTKLQTLAMQVIENLYRANEKILSKDDIESANERKKYQEEAMIDLKMMEYFAMLALENECILFKQYEQIAKQGAECLILLVNWIKSDKKRQ